MHLNCTAFTVNQRNRALKCGQTLANLPFCLTEAKVLQGKRMERRCACQQHGSSRKVTPKSSCGHSMVPTARAPAAVCPAHAASSPPATLSVFPRASAERVNSLVGLVLVSAATCSKLPFESRLGHDRTNSSLLLAHAC